MLTPFDIQIGTAKSCFLLSNPINGNQLARELNYCGKLSFHEKVASSFVPAKKRMSSDSLL